MEYPKNYNPWFVLLQEALVSRQVVAMTYHGRSKGELTERQIEPITMIQYGSGWHLIAWCRLRQEFRDFNLDRMERLVKLEEVFVPGNDLALQVYLKQIAYAHMMDQITLSMPKSMAESLNKQKFQYGWVSEIIEGEMVAMKFLVQQYDGIDRWVFGMGNAVTIMASEKFKNQVAALAN